MDSKKSPNSRRSKRQGKQVDENVWDCSVCTFRNTAEAFKCLMCDVRKGTSTRKPRINPQLVAQQVAQQQFTQSPNPNPKQKLLGNKSDKKGLSAENDLKLEKNKRPRLKNMDRNSAQHKAVTVNNVTVIITEFQPKRKLSTDGSSYAYDSSSNHSDAASSSGASETKQFEDSRVT